MSSKQLWKNLWCILAGLFLFALPVLGEELLLALEVRSFPDTEEQARTHHDLADAFNATISQAPGLAPVKTSMFMPKNPGESSDAASIAAYRSAGFHAAVVLELRTRGTRMAMTVRLYDPQLGKVIFGAARTAPEDLSLFSQLQGLAQEVTAALVGDRKAFLTPRSLEDQVLTLSGLIFTGSDEGAEVYLNGWILLGTMEGGSLDFPLPVARGQQVEVLVKKTGYHPRQVVLVPQKSGEELALPPLEPLHYWGIQAVWDPMVPASAGLALRFYPLPDRWYLQLEGGWRNADSSWAQLSGGGPTGFNPTGLVETPVRNYSRWGFETGVLFGEPEGALRLYAALGAGTWLYGLGETQDQLILPSVYMAAPILGLEFRSGNFRAGLALGSEFVFDTGTGMTNSGSTRVLLPGQVYVGATW